jgi:hypothetical protein
LEVELGKWPLIFCFALLVSPSHAQITPQDVTRAAMRDCVRDAIADNAVDETGAVLVFSCSAAKAKALYNFLGRRVRAEVVQDRNGTFENRPFGNSACYHRIGGGIDGEDFRCDLVMPIGDVLRD